MGQIFPSICQIRIGNYVSMFYLYVNEYVGHALAQLVEALRYKPEGRGLDARWCHWNFSLI
jgi:hypothetical protein